MSDFTPQASATEASATEANTSTGTSHDLRASLQAQLRELEYTIASLGVDDVCRQALLELERFEANLMAHLEAGTGSSSSWARDVAQAAETLVAATSADEVGHALLSFAARAGLDVARFYLVRPDSAYLELGRSWARDGRPLPTPGQRLPLSDHSLFATLSPGAVLTVENVSTDARVDDATRRLLDADGIGSFVAVFLASSEGARRERGRSEQRRRERGRTERGQGLFVAGHDEPATYDDDLRYSLLTLAVQAAATLEKLDLHEELVCRNEEMKVLNTIINVSSEMGSLRTVLGQVLRQLLQVLRFDAGLISLADEASGLLTLSIHSGLPDALRQSLIANNLQNTPCELVYQRGDLLGVQDLSSHDVPVDVSGLLDSGFQSCLGTPLLARERPLGTICLFGRSPRTYTSSDYALIKAIGQQVGVAVENVRLLERAQAALQEMASLYQVSASITAAKNLEEVLRAILNYVKPRDLDRCLIALLDDPETPPADRWVEVRAIWDRGGQEPGFLGNRFSPTHIPIIGQLGPDDFLVVNDFATDGVVDDRTQAAFQHLGVGAAAILPLTVGDNLLGWILAESVGRPHLFSDDEVNTLRAIVGQAAVAIQGRQLFDQVQRRALQLQTAAEVSHAAGSTLDPDELLASTVELIRDRFDLYHVSIFLSGEQGEYAVVKASTGQVGQQMLEQEHRLRIGGPSIVGAVAGTGRAHVAFDVGADAVHFDNPLLPDTRSEIALPLMTRGRVIGVLDVQSTQEAAFSKEDMTVLQTMADQLANAIENARLWTETQDALQEVSTVHQSYLRQEWELFLASRENKDEVGYLLTRDGLEPAPQVWPSEIEQAVQNRQLVTLSDADDVPPPASSEDDGGAGFPGSVPEPALVARSALAAPITLRGQVIGALDLFDPDQPREWTDDDLALIDAVTDQVALAVENARLFEQTQEALQETETLYRASTELNAARTYDDILAVLRVYTLFGQADRNVSLNLFNRPWVGEDVPEWSIPIARWNTLPPEAVSPRYPLRAFPSAARFLCPDAPTLIADAETDSRLDDNARALYSQRFRARSIIFAPLTVGGRWIGYGNAIYGKPTEFPEASVHRLMTLTGQAAVVVQSLRQLQEIEARARREAIIREIGAKVSSSMDLKTVLQTTVRELSQALGASQAIVHMRTQAEEPAPNAEEIEPASGHR